MKTGVLALVGLSLAGCISQQTYRESESALAACRQEAQSCIQARSEQDSRIAALQDALQTCEAARGVVAGLLDECRVRAEAAQTAVSGLDRRAAELRERLSAEILARDVEIEQLRDRLSLRVLDRILFKSGSAEILPEGRLVLDKVAAALNAGTEAIRVEGHTDHVPIGARLQVRYPTNWELSTARASSVVRYFVDRNQVAPERLEAVGFSKYRPVTWETSPEALQRNRRVEIVLTARSD